MQVKIYPGIRKYFCHAKLYAFCSCLTLTIHLSWYKYLFGEPFMSELILIFTGALNIKLSVMG
ncbi:MAG: hypothetical protein JWR61_1565 [Ferruginibacter sp.]|nr:hypothetical protein [Ferruginibacter sp.]